MKLVAVDLDGTLLNSSGQVPPQNVTALQHYRKKGGLVAVATGRSIRSVEELLLEKDILDYALTSNGALITQITPSLHFKKLASREIQPIIVTKVFNLAAQQNVTIIASQETQDERFEFTLTDSVVDSPYAQQFVLTNQKKPTQVGTKPYLKLALTDPDPSKLVHLQQLLTQENILSVFSDTYFLEVNAPDTSKASALEYLTQRLAIDSHEIMAFGDQQNDLAMLKYSGTAIAMGNAQQEIKNIATKITTSNDEAGVATILNTLK